MLAEHIAKAAADLEVTARLLLDGKEIRTPGYVPQTVAFIAKGAAVNAEVEFTFTDRALFDTVEWSIGGEPFRTVKTAYDGPRGSYRVQLDVGVNG